MAFTVTYYAGLGAAFLLACRRQGICPSICSIAHNWARTRLITGARFPERLLDVTGLVLELDEQEAADIARWAGTLTLPWHRSLYGGHTQLAPFLEDSNPLTRAWDQKFQAIRNDPRFEREILVALQPIPGHRATWEQSVGTDRIGRSQVALVDSPSPCRPPELKTLNASICCR